MMEGKNENGLRVKKWGEIEKNMIKEWDYDEGWLLGRK